jgi:hypothetical protein
VPFSGNTGNRWSFDGKGISRFGCYPNLNHAPFFASAALTLGKSPAATLSTMSGRSRLI